MKRRGFFAGLIGMITGTAAAQEQPRGEINSIGIDFDSVDFNNCNMYWNVGDKRYKLTPTTSICTMPFKECGLAHQINLARPILMLEEV
jgi:hypothetical protein